MALTVAVSKEEKSRVIITASLPAEDFASYRASALKHLSDSAKIDGFRSGHIPEEVLVRHIGEAGILEEMAHDAVETEYPRIVAEQNLSPIGRPSIRITKLAKDNPLEFTVETAVLPDVTLPDYRAIAKKIFGEKSEPAAATDAEIDAALLELRKQKYRAGKKPEELANEPAEADLPPLDDALAASFGPFKTTDEFKTALRESIAKEKEMRQRDKKIGELLDAIAAGAAIDIPDVLIESESGRMLREMKFEIERLGIAFADYLARTKKTQEALAAENREEAKKRVAINLSLDTIGEKEKLAVPTEELDTFAERLAKAHPDAPADSLRRYGEEVLFHQRVIAFLENL